jgi:uncharacterized protein involved in exopolysaccharide biosynthesis
MALLAAGAGAPAAAGDAVQTTRPPAIVQPLDGKAPASSAKATTQQFDGLQARLKTARVELGELKTRYTDLHPDVIAKKRQIRQLENRINAARK